MICRVQSLLSILAVASAATLGGCAVGTVPDDESSQSVVDALIDRDADGTAEPEAEAETEPSAQVLPPDLAERGTPSRYTRDWVSTEPQPVPWRETSASSASADDDESSPLPPPPGQGEGR